MQGEGGGGVVKNFSKIPKKLFGLNIENLCFNEHVPVLQKAYI